MPAAQDKKCYCGRPLGHTGRHIGYRVPDADGVKQHKLVPALEAEVANCHRDIARVKREIHDAQTALLDAETKLRPLVALLAVYQNKRIEGPGTQLAVVTQPPAQTMPMIVSDPVLDKPVLTEDDSVPIEMNFTAVAKWCDIRKLRFISWDDLPTINRYREKFELAPFKRKFGMT